MNAQPFQLNPATTGYRPAYHTGALCPGCGRQAWYVFRTNAECALCGTALPLRHDEDRPHG